MPLVALLPGSRGGEVARLARDFIGAASWLAARRPSVRFVAPMANARARALFTRALARAARPPPIELLDGRADQALTAANAALIASGTATLEALLCRCPMVVAYRVSRAPAGGFALFGGVEAPYFAQPNLLAGRAVVPELMQSAVTPQRLGAELELWLDSPTRVAALTAEFARIHAALRQGANERAAEAILALIDRRAAGGARVSPRWRADARVAGIDEAGRGPLAGPVVAAAVILPARRVIRGLDDSKQLEPEVREQLAVKIRCHAVAWGLGWADAAEIDALNILEASHLAMRRALLALPIAPWHVRIDGNRAPSLSDLPFTSTL